MVMVLRYACASMGVRMYAFDPFTPFLPFSSPGTGPFLNPQTKQTNPHRSFDPMAVVENDRAALRRYLPKGPSSRKPVPRSERCVMR